jgi:hypothetical protein
MRICRFTIWAGAALLTSGLLAGCSGDNSAIEAKSITEAIGGGSASAAPASIAVAYESMLYAKYSDRYAWESLPADRRLDDGLRTAYERYRKSVPGGFLVKEDADYYFICVSVGRKLSASEGFEIEAVRLSEAAPEGRPLLTIAVKPRDNEPVPAGSAGDVFVTALIRISKKALPDGVDITDLSMVGA